MATNTFLPPLNKGNIIFNLNDFQFQDFPISFKTADLRYSQITSEQADVTALQTQITSVSNIATHTTTLTDIAYISGYTSIANNSHLLTIGDTTATAKLQVKSTNEQFRLAYDANNYITFTVDISGQLIMDSVGTNPKFTFNDDLNLASGKVFKINNSQIQFYS